MWSLTSPRADRISGPEKFCSSARKDFFNSICPQAVITGVRRRAGVASTAAMETSKHRLSREFQRRSIFDFFNSIGHLADMLALGPDVGS
jgi:hypothetical protein